jgi:hypothetical protein
MAILSSTLTDTAAAISPAVGTDLAVTVMLFCNLNAVDPGDANAGKQYLDVYLVANSGSPSAVNKIANQIPIDAADTFTFSTERIVLSPGDRVYAKTSTSGQVSVTISYVII